MRSIASVIVVACLSSIPLGSSHAGSGRTVLDVSYDYSEVRLRPTYDPNIRGTRKFRLILSGNNQVTVQQSNSAGGARPSRAEWTNEMQAGSGAYSWRFAGPNRLTKLSDWPQSTSITTITTNGSKCTVRVREVLKPGFTEYKMPMLSRDEFGFYKNIVLSNFSCSIRNED
jgi:hypothetical protein